MIGILLSSLIPPHFCACHYPESGFPTPYVMGYFCFQWFEGRGSLFCWYWWNCWPSLFYLSFI